MKSSLSATHLFRHLALFLFIAVFLLTMARAGYVLWRFPEFLETNTLVDAFLMGLRYDLALCAVLLVPVLLIGGVFGMFKITRGLAKFFVALLLMLGMIFILVTELITPYFMVEQGIRPDIHVLAAIEDPVATIASLWSAYMIPAIIGLVLTVLIIIAYQSRLEVGRLLKFRLSRVSTPFLIIVGLAVAGLAIYSGIDFSKPPLSPTTHLISTETIINEIALNTGYKSLHSVVSPMAELAGTKVAKKLVSLLFVLFCTGCAAGKSVTKPEDIGDDGKRNTVVLTYDIKLYTANRYPSVKSTSLRFRCPKNSAGFGGNCFNLKAPFLGIKEVNGYSVNAFEQSGTKIFQMKYGEHVLQSLQHSVVVDRVPELQCTTSKKTKKRTCRNVMKDVTDRHSDRIPTPIAVNVGSGAGCQLGHFSLTMFEGDLVDFSVTNDKPFSAEMLSDLSPDMAAAVISHASRPCRK